MLLHRAARVEKNSLNDEFEDSVVGKEPETASNASPTSIATEIPPKEGQNCKPEDAKCEAITLGWKTN